MPSSIQQHQSLASQNRLKTDRAVSHANGIHSEVSGTVANNDSKTRLLMNKDHVNNSQTKKIKKTNNHKYQRKSTKEDWYMAETGTYDFN